MSDFFARLVDRAQQRAPVLEWRRPGPFESIGSLAPEPASGTPADRAAPAMVPQPFAGLAPATPVPDFAGHKEPGPASASAAALRSPEPAALVAPTSNRMPGLIHQDVPVRPAPLPLPLELPLAARQPERREVIHQLETVRETRIELQPQVTIAHHHPRNSASLAHPAGLQAPLPVQGAVPPVPASSARARPLQLVDSVIERRTVPDPAPQPVATSVQPRPALIPAPVGPAPRQLMRSNPLTASMARPQAPSISVSIGRIEIRADAKPAAGSSKATTGGPQLSLDAYLRSRGGRS